MSGPFLERRVWARVSGGDILADPNEYIGRAAFYVGDLDRKITWICRHIVRPGDTVIDIGANIGLVTVLLASLVGPEGKVYAFEPNPAVFADLEETLRYNKLTNVALSSVAIGRTHAHLELHVPQDNVGRGSFVRHGRIGDCKTYSVPVVPLSDVVTKDKTTTIRLIKVDVEGFEAEVFDGSREILRSIRPEAILFEMNESSLSGSLSTHPVFSILREFDYGFFRVPRCLIRMHLERFDPDSFEGSAGNDFLAVPNGKCFERIAELVRAPN